jgi:hypothetical protein
MYIGKVWMVLVVCAGLAACGDSAGEQALYGGAAGVVGSALIDGDLVTGAAVGAAGNLLYCQTNPGQCN